MKNSIRVLTVMLVAVLTACGGGGGGSSSLTYDGLTSQATITDTNVEDLAALAYYGSELEVPLPLAQVQGGELASGSPAPVIQDLTELVFSLPEKVQLDELSPDMARTVWDIPASPLEGYCEASGSASVSGTWNDVSGALQAKVAFANCTEYDGNILNGSMGLNATIPSGGMDFEGIDLSLTFNLLSFESPGEEKVVIDGTASISFESQSAEMVLLLNVVMNDVYAGKMAKLVNYRVAVVEFAGYDQVSISADRVYGSDFGYVVLSTDPPILIDSLGNPYQGVYRIDGAGGTWAEVDFSITSAPQGSYGDATGLLGTFSI